MRPSFDLLSNMAPPQQAGKFKPRKPVKKIRVGAASANTNTSGGDAPAPTTVRSSSASRGAGGRGGRSGRGGGRGREGGGRGGGRGGRGIPVQQGQAFFVAAPAPSKQGSGGTKSSTTKDAANRTAAAVARRLQASAAGRGAGGGGLPPGGDSGPQEEIVGMMDEAIGTAVPDGAKSSRAGSGRFSSSNEAPNEQLGSNAKTLKFVDDETGYTYDSDSSQEERNRKKKNRGFPSPSVTMPEQEPLQLPFPPSQKPIGIGSHRAVSSNTIPALDSMQTDDDLASPSSHPSMPLSSITHDPSVPSPFADVNQHSAYEFEKDSWFLVQLPTRLPPLRSSMVEQDGPPEPGDDDGTTLPTHADQTTTLQETAKIDTAEVATPPVRVECFDNAMTSAIPGRMGKIRVHQSGKTVLVLTATDGSETLFNVTEGLTCAFQQQAAIIDTEKSSLIQLGTVGKTLVVTPDL